MKKVIGIGLVVLLTAFPFLVSVGLAETWIDGTVAKVIQSRGSTWLALKTTAGGEVVYKQIVGLEEEINRFLAIAMMAQSNKMVVHVRLDEGADTINLIAAVTGE